MEKVILKLLHTLNMRLKGIKVKSRKIPTFYKGIGDLKMLTKDKSKLFLGISMISNVPFKKFCFFKKLFFVVKKRFSENLIFAWG